MAQGRSARRSAGRARDGPAQAVGAGRRGLIARPDASIRRARDLAFSGRISDARAALSAARDPNHAGDVRWLRAYLAAASGDFRTAERLARSLLDFPDPTIRARAACTLGSVLRQTGRHSAAREVERPAMRAAPNAELRAHLAIGLAADAVGLGDLRSVDEALAGVRGVRHWRVRVRMAWVRCERELLAGRPAAAARHARRALEVSSVARARRHEAKSLLFLGAALRSGSLSGSGATSVRARREAERSLRRASRLASRIGARPLATVAESLLAEGVRR